MHKVLKNKDGFTLVEMLVAIAIMGIAFAGISITFQSQTRSFSMQEQVSSMQIGGALALSRMAQEIRMSGYGLPAGVAAVSTATDGASGASDSITIVTNLSASSFTSQAIGAGATDIFLDDVSSYSGLSTGTALIILDPQRALITTGNFASTDAGNSKIILQTGVTTTIPQGGYVGVTAGNISYSIDTTDPAHPFLSRNGEVLSEDVEDLQIAYGEDDNLDGQVDAWRNVPTVNDNVVALRVSIVARARYPEQGTSYSVGALENGNAHGPDNYRRRVYSTTIKLRNLLI